MTPGDFPNPMGQTVDMGYQHGYDDAKSEPCAKCKENAKIVIDHCIELIAYLEIIDGVTVVEPFEGSDSALDTSDKIKTLKNLRRHFEYG